MGRTLAEGLKISSAVLLVSASLCPPRPVPATAHLGLRGAIPGVIEPKTPASGHAATALSIQEADEEAPPVATLKLERGDLSVLIRDNSRSPDYLSCIGALINTKDAADFDAFDPDTIGASSGLNFEHITSGHANPNNRFSPRHGKYLLYPLSRAGAEPGG